MRDLRTRRFPKLVLCLAAICALPGVSRAQSTCQEPPSTAFNVVALVAPSTATTNSLFSSEDAYSGPVAMAIAPDRRVFICKMKSGEIRVYNPSNPNATTFVGKVPTYFNAEDGMLGIALDPNFASTKWIYLFYADTGTNASPNRRDVLSRFTLDTTVKTTTGLAQLTNQKIILTFPRDPSDFHHSAGGLAFDQNGILVISTGDNTLQTADNTNKNAGYGAIFYPVSQQDAQRTAANSNDLRGKILRIHPLPFADNQTPATGLGTTYDIPAGNLWEKINNTAFNPKWDNTDSIGKVRKEIYTMGNRNPYRPRIDTKSGWIFYGDVGPDANKDSSTRGPSGHDEWNLATAPGFFGHPYCNGYNVPYNAIASVSGTGTNAVPTYGKKYDCLETGDTTTHAPLMNVSPNNTGVHHLPPAVPALVAYTSGNSTDDDVRFNTVYATSGTPSHGIETAISGPMYRYDTASASTVKFPPYYEGKIFFLEFNRRFLRVMNINPDGTLPAGAAGVENFAPSGMPLPTPMSGGVTTVAFIDAQFGPDGALYLLKEADNWEVAGYGPALYRVEYNGTYDNTCYKPFVATVGTPSTPVDIEPRAQLRKSIAPVFANGFISLPQGYRTLELYDLSGRQVWSFHREAASAAKDVPLPSSLAHGMWQAKLLP